MNAKTPNTQKYCKQCCCEQTLERQRAFKRLCVEYKGGKCSKCGYNKCLGVLQFHHLDPSKKDFGIAKIRKFSINKLDQLVEQELDKCVILCANCHAEEHMHINSSKWKTIRKKPTS